MSKSRTKPGDTEKPPSTPPARQPRTRGGWALDEAEAFVRQMASLGATYVKVGDIAVHLGLPSSPEDALNPVQREQLQKIRSMSDEDTELHSS